MERGRRKYHYWQLQKRKTRKLPKGDKIDVFIISVTLATEDTKIKPTYNSPNQQVSIL